VIYVPLYVRALEIAVIVTVEIRCETDSMGFTMLRSLRGPETPLPYNFPIKVHVLADERIKR